MVPPCADGGDDGRDRLEARRATSLARALAALETSYPDAVRWYADGKLIHEEKGAVVRRLTRPQQFIVHFWASDPLKHWLGPLDVTRAPWKFDIACLAYSPSYSAETPCR